MEAAAPDSFSPPAPPPKAVRYLARATLGLTFILICFGGLVKSIEAGLSVPDWPLSYGQPKSGIALGLLVLTVLLGVAWVATRSRIAALAAIASGCVLAGTYYLFGPLDWYRISSVRAEHGHRLIAGTVGFLMCILAAAVWETDKRPAVRKLAVCALLAVVVQALLGGLTVLYQLPPLVSSAHGGLAQAFFSLLAALTVLLAPDWFEMRPLASPHANEARKPLRRFGAWMIGAIYLQILLGTAVRHTPYDPQAEGQTQFWWHLGSHLAGFLFVAHTVARVLVQTLKRYPEVAALTRPAFAVGGLLGLQIALGVGIMIYRLITPTGYAPNGIKEAIATAHVAVGGLTLVSAVYFTLRAHKLLPAARAESAGAEAAAALAGGAR